MPKDLKKNLQSKGRELQESHHKIRILKSSSEPISNCPLLNRFGDNYSHAVHNMKTICAIKDEHSISEIPRGEEGRAVNLKG